MDNNTKQIEVVSGDGKDLNISEVSTHLSSIKPKIKDKDDKKQDIVIPKVKNNTENKK